MGGAHELFEAWAARQPDAPAVESAEGGLTYGELDGRAERLAGVLTGLGVGLERLVAVCCRRSRDLPVAMLAALKAGAAYLPLDPDHPAERLEAALADSGAAALLTHGGVAWRPRLPIPVREVDGVLPRSRPGARRHVSGDQLAYAIYTSGSTGAPKATLIPHRGLSNLVEWHGRAFGVGPGERSAMVASPAFDASTWEVMGALANGAALLVPDDDTRLSAERLRDWLVVRRVTVAFTPTPLAEQLVELPWPADAGLRLLLTGGDRLRRRPPPGLPFELVNDYGPAENSVVSTWTPVAPGGEGTPDIGLALPNQRACALDRDLEPVPSGAVGELHLAGSGLARGYLDRPGLTAERFLPDPHGGEPGSRMYRTGDLVRQRPDGAFEFVGRADDQVKIRASRVEPGEIEQALTAHPAVAQAAVVATGPEEARRLAAFVALRPGAEVTRQTLRRHLQQRLPAFMVPAEYALLDALPLTSNGKVDRRALAARLPEAAPAADGPACHEAPADELTERLSRIWGEVLHTAEVRTADDFFDLGGDSLLAVTLMHEIGRQLGVELPVSTVFRCPTVAELASAVRERSGA